MTVAPLNRVPSAATGEADVREDERRRLARELHDGLAQSLAGALFGVDLALSTLGGAPSAAREEVLAARALVRDALDEVRAIMAGLRPRQLEERGLAAALRALAATPPLWGTEVSVEIRGLADGDRLPPDVELGLYRIAQEAVGNARRHGAAAHVWVSLAVRPSFAELSIFDDGSGMAGDSLTPGRGSGEGLPGMRERARLLGGELRVESEAGHGTRVSVTAVLEGDRVALEEGRA